MLLLPLLLASSLFAADVPPGNLRLSGALELSANGDATGRLRFEFAPRDFAGVKARPRNAVGALRDFRPKGPSCEVAPDSALHLDDAASEASLDLHLLGAARSVALGRWELAPAAEADFVTSKQENGRASFHFYEVGATREGTPYRGPFSLTLPAGATDAAWDEARRVVAYSLPPAAEGEPRIEAQVRTREGLMPGLYKMYGMPDAFPDLWVARVVLRNAGTGAARDLHLRLRIEGYTEWTDLPSAEVVPGQSVVLAWHPLLNRTITQLKATTPMDLEVAWTWKGGEGNSSQRISFLGGREFVFSSLLPDETTGSFQENFSNAPFLAAWVSRDDAVVQQFAAMANKNAAGVGAAYDDGDAVKAVRAIYELMVLNDFTYQSPRGLADPTLSFDSKLVQNLKYPRDVIRDRSGTCIELAMLFAAMAHDIGLRPILALKEGHCLPIIKLPVSGRLLPIEATGIKGGARFGADPFDKVKSEAQATIEKADKEGKLILIDVEAEWQNGVACPELDALPPDILKAWGIGEKGVAGGLDPHADATKDKAGFAGGWKGEIPVALADGKWHSFPGEVLIQADDEGKYRMFASVTVEGQGKIEQEFVAEEQEGKLVFQGTTKTAIDAAGDKKALEPDRGMLMKEGEGMAGKFGNDQLGFVSVKLTRK